VPLSQHSADAVIVAAGLLNAAVGGDRELLVDSCKDQLLYASAAGEGAEGSVTSD
jgi:hypothetical protein